MKLNTPELQEDPVLVEMGNIVQAADIAGKVDDHPAAYGLQLISKGFPESSGGDDSVTINKSRYLYDSFFASIKIALSQPSKTA